MPLPEEENLTKIAVVGCGHHSTRRVFPNFARLPVRLVGVCDLNEELAARNARRFGGEKVFTDTAKMLDETKPDGLVVCAGPEIHSKLSLVALERGIPVYCEKPPAVTAADAWKVAQASRKAGKLAMTGFKYRYGVAMQKVKRIMQTPEFGGVSALSVLRTAGAVKNDPSNPRSQFLLDFCCHPIDMIAYLGGDVREVFVHSPTPESYAISAQFENGAVGSFLFSCRGSWNRPVDRTEILGNQGHVIFIDDQIFMTYHVDGVIKDSHDPKFCTAGGDSLEQTGFEPELRAFVQYLRGERKAEDIPSNIAESAKSMALYEAIRKSAETRQPQKPERLG
ncbi:MAG TPA: Gfo/Idh/MocA family oxidoreductase [Planctomycetota bacterium]|nr:Gfo/Idh/MocA family oxidoreductase [Planctomycetota bacterium]